MASDSRNTATLAVVVLAVLLPGCAAPRPARVAVRELEHAPTVPLHDRRQALVSRVSDVAPLYTALTEHVGLIEVRRSAEWRVLARAAVGIGPEPDLSRGTVIGLLWRAGLPLDGGWPVEIDAIRVAQGAGYVVGRARAGTCLPDGTCYLDLAYVPSPATVLVVDFGNLRVYPGR
ncbi:MAG: hypothetical protein CHACPFDD_04073 [Phycisphaerae bacterium]|nr:hypothetical protein [Phycisphaerae bacterium]